MSTNILVLLLGAFGIGMVAGLRSLTALAVTCWAAHLGWIDITGFRLAFLASAPAVAATSILAILELVADKLPSTSNRTAAGPLAARIFTGAVSAIMIFASVGQSVYLGAILGAVGAVAGAFAGYHLRHKLVTDDKIPDLKVALAEDVVAVVGGFLLVSHIIAPHSGGAHPGAVPVTLNRELLLPFETYWHGLPR
jgi:uncharacterized membrane protein